MTEFEDLKQQVDRIAAAVMILQEKRGKSDRQSDDDCKDDDQDLERDQDQNRAIRHLMQQMEDLRRGMVCLEQARLADAHQINNLTQASSMEHIVSERLEAIKEQLQPLRDLTPARTRMDRADEAKLVAIRDEQKRPAWNKEAGPKDTTTAVGRRRL